jgi:hypothetical protein
MQIEISKLRKLTDRLLTHIEQLGHQSVDISHDYYWDIDPPARYDFTKEPGEPTVGQLYDDWADLEKILQNDREPIAYALVWLSAVLRAVGEEVIG